MVCFLKYGEYVFLLLKTEALSLFFFLNKADCIFMSLWEQGSSLYLDTISMKADCVLDAGEILVCCVCYLIFLLDRGTAVGKEHSYMGHESPGVLHIARLHHPLTRAVTQHSSHSAASLMWNKRGFLLGAPWRASEMLAFPVAYSLCHSNYLGLYFDFLPLSQPSRR